MERGNEEKRLLEGRSNKREKDMRKIRRMRRGNRDARRKQIRKHARQEMEFLRRNQGGGNTDRTRDKRRWKQLWVKQVVGRGIKRCNEEANVGRDIRGKKEG